LAPPPPIGLAPPPLVGLALPLPHQPFADFFAQFNIQSYYWADLMTLANFDIVVVADDSGS